MLNLGPVPASTIIYIPFNTFAAAGGSVTITGLAVTDIEIFKNGSATQRASDAGYVLLDTDGIDFDGITGIHGFSVDLADDTDAGFYAAGSFYWVVVSSITADSQTLNFVAAVFRIVAAETATGTPKVDITHVNGDAAAVTAFARMLATAHVVTVSGTPSTTVIAFSNLPAGLANDALKDKVLSFPINTTTAAIRGEGRLITAFNGTTKEVTVAALTSVPVAGDTAVIG